MRDDKAGEPRILARRAVNERAQFEPILGTDRGAADLTERDRHRFRDLPGFREAVEQRLRCQLLPEFGVIEHIEAAGPERGDRAAGADHGNTGKRCGHGVTSP